MRLLSVFLFIITLTPAVAKVIHVGPDQHYKNIVMAADVAQPGDKILVQNGVYLNRENISGLQGETDKPIYIIAEDPGQVIYRGNSESWHLSSCSNIYINGFIFENQTANGMNIDDSGNDDASTFNITIENCIFRDMNGNGNNDLLKLSGLYHFKIRNCTFQNGADGGSGIDMVGCHFGLFEGNTFENMGSNCIQAKGGTQHITITRNYFKDGGNRALNLGGSTGLAYFRPIDAKFEAADILVYANVFIRGWAPIAYVGSVRVKVINNTIIHPENWVFRILQETVDTTRFESCGDNEFSNNIIYFGNNLHRIVNIGPNTRPTTFTFANNLWYNKDDPGFGAPQLPSEEIDAIYGMDPLFKDIGELDLELTQASPAIATAYHTSDAELDYENRYFAEDPSIGAFEYEGVFKDFSGEIGDERWYSYDYGYRLLTTEDKKTEGTQEYSSIYTLVHVGDASGGFRDAPQFYESKDQVFYRENEFRPFQLLYDFNLNKGDTLRSLETLITSTIDSVDYKYYAGKVRKVLYTSPVKTLSIEDYNLGEPGIIIQGIYSVNTRMEGNPYYNEDWYADFHEHLRCYFTYNEEGEQLFELHFGDEPCDSIKVNTLDLSSKMHVFPNPLSRKLFIDIPNAENVQYQIYNTNGATVATGVLVDSSINVENLIAGTYYLLLRIEEGNRKLIRFVKVEY